MIPNRIKDFGCLAVSKYPTPFYLIDLDQIKDSLLHFLALWEKEFLNFKLAYSYKSNSLKAITQSFAKMNSFAEVVSGTELKWALEDGFKPENIFFDGPIKKAEELNFALRERVNIQVDSLDELKLLISLCHSKTNSPSISLRLSTSYRSLKKSRFGLLKHEVDQACYLLKANNIDVKGIHLHLGSNIVDASLFANELEENVEIIQFLSSSNQPLWLDIGGGYPANSNGKNNPSVCLNDIIKNVKNFFDRYRLNPQQITLITEPGRCLVEDFGYLLSKVCVKKEREDRYLLILDAGVHLVRSISTWRHPIVFLDHLLPKSEPLSPVIKYDIYGSNCFESDILTTNYENPHEINPGAVVVIGSAGGYDIPSANAWIRPLPAIYGIFEGQLVTFREAQREDDIRREQVNLKDIESLNTLNNSYLSKKNSNDLALNLYK